MAATNAEVATNQALRFANALRWERGQRKEGEERLEAANEELGKARKLNKKLTAELQATSALLNSAAKAAELLQKQKEKTRQLESQLRAAKRELDVVRESGVAGRGPDASAGASLIRPDEHEMLLDTLQRQQKDVAELRELLAARDEEIGRLRGDAVTVNSPLKMDPAELLRGAPRVATQSGSDPVIQSLWIDDNVADDPQAGSTTGRPGRAPLGSLDNNARSSSFSAQKRKPYAQPRIGRGCTCGGCSMDDAGNYRLMCGTASGSAETEAETVIDLGNDVDDDAEHDEFGSGQVVEIVEGGDGDLAELDLAGAEENANTFDNEASKSGFGEGPVPGGHAPYYCTSLDCELAVVKQLGWEPGAGTAVEDEGGAPAGCGRVMEGQLRFDSARYGAALDVVFTGSVEHLRDQEWQNDSSATECACCQSVFTLLNRRHHCRVCGVIYCSDCLLRSLPYFVPEEEELGPQMAAEPGAEFRSSLALTVCDQDGPEIAGTMPGKVKRAAILSCHTCFAMLQILAVSQAGPKTSGLRFNMCHAGS